jgi:hypothetical protein
MLFPQAQRLDVRCVDGAALVRYGECYSAVPLSAREVEGLPSFGPILVDAVGGYLRQRRLDERDRVDPCAFYNLEEYVFERASAFSAPSVPEAAIQATVSHHRDAIEHAIGDPPAEVALFGLGTQLPATELGRRTGFDLPLAFVGAVRRLLEVLKLWIRAFASRASESTPVNSGPLPRRANQKFSLGQRFRSWVRRWLWTSQFGQIFGAAQSRYLGRMLAMFERGDIEEALRHAIPTSKLPKSASETLSPHLLPAGPRKTLELGTVRRGQGTLVLQSNLFAKLRTTYEAAFSQLVNRGQIAEAAFVLSELLEDDARAVSFLEGHGRLLQAAKLAELRGLPAGLVVRQWFIAGDRDRAIAIARRDGAFEDAILRLKGIPAAQAAMRLLWADALAAAGNYTGAALTLRDMPEGHAMAKEWLERAVEIGGVAGAQALGLCARLFPADFERTRERVLALLSDGNADAPASRVALARELVHARDAGCVALTRGVVRALIRDSADAPELMPRHELVALARHSRDGALQADIPDFSAHIAMSTFVEEPRQMLVRHGDRGTTQVRDVCSLPRGKFLVARGEAGCSLLGPTGKLLQHFDVPAERLVISTYGDRALALVRRDNLHLVSRIDLRASRCSEWCSLRLSAYASTFDGSAWYVGVEQRVCALDVTVDRATSLWSSAVAPATITEVHWSPACLTFATQAGECWTHQLSPHRLTQRVQIDDWPVLGPKGVLATIAPEAGEGVELWTLKEFSSPGRRVPLGATSVTQVVAAVPSTDWLAVAMDVPVEVPRVLDVKLISFQHFRVEVNLRLEDARRACVRFQPHLVTVGDDCGRIIGIELATLRQCANLRL